MISKKENSKKIIEPNLFYKIESFRIESFDKSGRVGSGRLAPQLALALLHLLALLALAAQALFRAKRRVREVRFGARLHVFPVLLQLARTGVLLVNDLTVRSLLRTETLTGVRPAVEVRAAVRTWTNDSLKRFFSFFFLNISRVLNSESIDLLKIKKFWLWDWKFSLNFLLNNNKRTF